MSRRPKIGQYRHTPGPEAVPGPDGRLRPLRVKRRFPLLGIVVLLYGVLTAAASAGVSWLFQATGNGRLLPKHLSQQAMPPAPSLENLLFGIGLPEMVLAGALAGWLLWRQIWSLRVPPDIQERGPGAVLPSLLVPGLLRGAMTALLMLPVGMFGLCVRGMPAAVPGPARLLFGVFGTIPLTVTAALTGIILLVFLLLGLLMGAATAVAVAFLWPHYPEEPAVR